MTSGMPCWRRRSWPIVVGAALSLVVAAAGWWWASLPRTPEELYEARCSACHALPNLSDRSPEDMAAIVWTMRERNGADAVISLAEARLIIEYMEQWKEP